MSDSGQSDPKRTPRLRKRAVQMLALVAMIAVGRVAYQRSVAPGVAAAPAAPAAGIPVVVGSATTRDLPIWFSGLGTVTPLSSVNVKVRVDGQLQSVHFSEGQIVQAGDLLAEIDPRLFQAQLAQAQANRQKDVGQLTSAKVELARAAKLASAGAGTGQTLDAMRAQVATLEATIAADQALVDTAKLNFDFTRITSPVAGRVGLRQVDPGSIVHASDTIGLVTVTQMQPISVLFSLPQDGLRAILAGQSNGQLAVAVDTRDGTQHIADGTLVFVDSQVDQSTGQIRLKAFFTDGDNALWPGEFVTARLLVRTDHNATVVPARAVQNSQAGPYIFTIGPDNTAVFRPVKVGATVEGYTAILSGVAPGQTVVLDGQSRLSPNAKVSPAQAPLSDNLGAPQ